jgi:putative tryptophan/tyrosine transport system substrate-binding protein
MGMKRREFIGLVGGGVAAWPLIAKAQNTTKRTRRIGLLMGYSESDPESQSRVSIFRQAMERAGFEEGKNIQIELRWANADTKLMAQYARELVALQPDVIVANTTPVTAAIRRETKSIPIVFVIVSDPQGEGFITSLARPSGNLTGFTNLEGSIGGKWLELLREIDPRIQRAAILYNPETAPRAGRYFGDSFEATARSYNLVSVPMPVRSLSDIENSIAAFASEPGSGLVVPSDTFTTVQRKPIISLTAKHGLPAVYSLPLFVADGGLLGFGSDAHDQFVRSALYVARILNGEKPENLPVQAPIKYELAINLKTAKALGLTVPPTLLARADEVIE